MQVMCNIGPELPKGFPRGAKLPEANCQGVGSIWLPISKGAQRQRAYAAPFAAMSHGI